MKRKKQERNGQAKHAVVVAAPTPHVGHRLVKKPEMADALSIGVRTLEGWMRRGLPHVRLSYRCVRFQPDEVHSWVARKFRTVRRGPIGRFGGRDNAKRKEAS